MAVAAGRAAAASLSSHLHRLPLGAFNTVSLLEGRGMDFVLRVSGQQFQAYKFCSTISVSSWSFVAHHKQSRGPTPRVISG
jgi:hypothetical protein